MAHAYAPFNAGYLYIVPAAQVIYRAYLSAGLKRGHGGLKGIHGAAGNYHLIDALAAGELQGLLFYRAVLVAYEVRCAVQLRHLHALGAGTHGDYAGSAPKVSARHGHEANGAYAYH